MKIKITPREKVSIDAEIDDQALKEGAMSLFNFIKSKLPFKIEIVAKNGDQNKHQD